MSWLYSRALVEEYSEGICLDGAQSALWSGTPTPQASWLPAKTTAACRLSRSGMTFKPLTDDHGEGVLMWCLEASRVRISARPARARESKGPGVDSGWKWQESSVKWSHSTSSWKTRQRSLLEGLDEFSETWPKWGIMRDGECWEQTPLEPVIIAPESGYVPTPIASDYKGGARNGRDSEFKHWLKRRLGNSYPHPRRVEEMMLWPIGWSELEPLETDKFQQWLRSHGRP